MEHLQDSKGDRYLHNQTNPLLNIRIITDNRKNLQVDAYSIDTFWMPYITEIVTKTKSIINIIYQKKDHLELWNMEM